jgi:hypothetical protein
MGKISRLGERMVRNRFGSRTSEFEHLILLAPPCASAANFGALQVDPLRHKLLLREAQRLRGRVYLRDGAITARQLTRDGRLVHSHDTRGWQLLVLNHEQRVAGCIRYASQDDNVSFSELGVADSALAHSPTWGTRLRRAVEAKREDARRRGIGYAEVGGWALMEELRYSKEALRITLHIYGLMKFLGGALATATATLRHNSSSILRKLGGQGLIHDGVPLPSYYDPQYECDMEILGFDSDCPSAKYEEKIRECQDNLLSTSVICSEEINRWEMEPDEMLVTA